jgi:hypothetical protein
MLQTQFYQYKAVQLRINGVPDMLADLKNNFNIVPRKSLILKPPKKLSFEHSLAFIIGYIDGDGSICKTVDKIEKNNKVIDKEFIVLSICGTYEMLCWIKKFFDTLIPTPKLANVLKTGNIYRYGIKGDRAIKLIKQLKLIGVPKLERKWNRFEELDV